MLHLIYLGYIHTPQLTSDRFRKFRECQKERLAYMTENNSHRGQGAENNPIYKEVGVSEKSPEETEQ